MRIAGYLPNSTADGIGIRQVFFTQGCNHHCKGCHNPQTWKMDGGEDWPIHVIVSKVLSSPHAITFSGGDPFYQADELFKIVKRLDRQKNIWVYTGFTWEEIIKNSDYSRVLPYIDVLVDGQFKEELKDSKLLFRGSSNQRIIDVRRTLYPTQEIKLWRDGQYY